MHCDSAFTHCLCLFVRFASWRPLGGPAAATNHLLSLLGARVATASMARVLAAACAPAAHFALRSDDQSVPIPPAVRVRTLIAFYLSVATCGSPATAFPTTRRLCESPGWRLVLLPVQLVRACNFVAFAGEDKQSPANLRSHGRVVRAPRRFAAQGAHHNAVSMSSSGPRSHVSAPESTRAPLLVPKGLTGALCAC
ncbi:hypothetical protein TRVL_04354 [Trypanosoma vivax]|nr:hypothetical protein TRVL_04354 [Trypanosoma vivax]